MNPENQIEIPQSFVELYLRPGRSKPSESWQIVMERYNLCEDMANLLTNTAGQMLFELKVTESDVLDRCHRGLALTPGVFSTSECRWVTTRLAELMNWPFPAFRNTTNEAELTA